MPRNRTLTRMMVASVTTAVTGAASKLFFAAGARLRPISATMAPVTMGGMSRLIQPAPNFCTMAPTRAKAAPARTTPPRAPGTPNCCWDAMMGAMNAKLEPR
jgi:hypothetical protein